MQITMVYIIGASLSESHTDKLYVHNRMCMFVSNGITQTVNPNDHYKTKYVTIALMKF